MPAQPRTRSRDARANQFEQAKTGRHNGSEYVSDAYDIAKNPTTTSVSSSRRENNATENNASLAETASRPKRL